MVYCIADNITTPLGDTSEANYQAVKSGRSALCRYEHLWGIPHPFTASLFTEQQTQSMAVEGMTRFESLVLHSIRQAVSGLPIDLSSDRVVLILCTTKANIELLTDGHTDTTCTPATAARHVAALSGISTAPIVVCNACISGVSGLILGQRLLETRQYDYAIVCGADVQCRFTISGFQSLLALSAEECRPFDIERIGLNLGEAAATLVLSNRQTAEAPLWTIRQGAVRNDAFHISSPSKNAEGAYLALSAVLTGTDTSALALVNAHGTATMYNDQMESVAIERAGLGSTPVNALKGYLGHTLGAAGIIESILTMKALDDHTLLATRGYLERGVSGKITIVAQQAATEKDAFIKMISGFGGCNGAVLFSRQTQTADTLPVAVPDTRMTHRVQITPGTVQIDGQTVNCPDEEKTLLTWLYKQYVNDYPKYYKMDPLSRLGFVAAELLLKAEGEQAAEARTDRAVILFNHTSSILADRQYEASIQDKDHYFPSPAAFVYTLPNMVTGEVAIRHQYRGETSFYILRQHDEQQIRQIISASFSDPATRSIISGWLDYQDDDDFTADLFIIERT